MSTAKVRRLQVEYLQPFFVIRKKRDRRRTCCVIREGNRRKHMKSKLKNGSKRLLALMLMLVMAFGMLPASAQAGLKYDRKITITSNIWDPTVQVVKTPKTIYGAESVGLNYENKELMIQGNGKVTVAGTQCKFSHFLINGTRYDVTQNVQNFTDVAGFDGKFTILTKSYYGVKFPAEGTLTDNITIEYVYENVPENPDEPTYTPTVKGANTDGTATAAFAANSEEGSIWTVTGNPRNSWYQLDYVEAPDGTRYTSSDGKTAKVTVKEADQTFKAYFKAAVGKIYNETDASSVNINFTLSNDGYPLMGKDADQTILSNLDVTIPYFDLNDYGLSKYYRYGTAYGWGDYTDTNLIERPTLLHAYIYLIERYYMGLDEEECGTGESNILDYLTIQEIPYMDETAAYETTRENGALTVTQNATSLYMTSFWGHDQNLMYFWNHEFPLMGDCWGSTCDYILLEDGDRVDVGLFSDWNFYKDGGGFTKFDQDSYALYANESLTVKTYTTETKEVQSGGPNEGPVTSEPIPVTNMNVAVYDSSWNKVADLSGAGTYTHTFTSGGTYYLMAQDANSKTENARLAPATAKVTVWGLPEQDENDYYLLDSKEDMIWFQDYTSSSDHKEVKGAMTADIDISAVEWTTISNYAGEFDGRNHTLTVNLTDTSLFTDLTGTVKNLTVAGEITATLNTTQRVGGIASTVKGGALIDNCINRANITMTKNGKPAGGIVGAVWSGVDKNVTIQNCKNYGTLQGEDYLGGILGMDYNQKPVYITSCENHGAVNAQSAGGIMGQTNDNTIISQCLNDASITGTAFSGGIAARIPYYTTLVEKSVNKGVITGNRIAGGIVGYSTGYIENCYNTGAVIGGSESAGGISGTQEKITVRNTYTYEVGNVLNCYTTGTVRTTGAASVGAAIGKASGGDVSVKKFQVYALTGSCENLIGTKVDEAFNDLTAFKTSAELKAADMVSTLGSNYKIDAGNVNGGYPVLTWQKSEGSNTGTPTADSYTISMGDNSNIAIGETANVTISVANNSETTYNAYQLTVTYDAQKLTYKSINTDAEVKDVNGTLTISGYGADKTCASDKLILSFEGKASGEANVIVTKANIDKAANANTQDAPEALLVETTSKVTVGGYRVTLGGDFTGDAIAEAGADYTFTAKDKHYNYTISASMGGSQATVEDNQDGTYTIKNVTGALVISSTKTPKEYTVTVTGTGAADVTAPEKAIYLSSYKFEVTKDERYDYDVKMNVGGGIVTPTLQTDGKTYAIGGSMVIGDITITVTKTLKSSSYTTITFTGSGSADVVGGTTQIAANGTDFTFQITEADNYIYTVTLDGSTLTADEDGKYTIAGSKLTGTDVTVTVTKEEQVGLSVNVASYLTLDAKTMWLITAAGTLDEGKVYAYDGSAMYWSSKYNAYCWLEISDKSSEEMKQEAAGKIAEASADKVSIAYDCDVNETETVDVNDAQLIYNMYNAAYEDFTSVSMQKFLEADINGDKAVNTTDAAAVVAKMHE